MLLLFRVLELSSQQSTMFHFKELEKVLRVFPLEYVVQHSLLSSKSEMGVRSTLLFQELPVRWDVNQW